MFYCSFVLLTVRDICIVLGKRCIHNVLNRLSGILPSARSLMRLRARDGRWSLNSRLIKRNSFQCLFSLAWNSDIICFQRFVLAALRRIFDEVFYLEWKVWLKRKHCMLVFRGILAILALANCASIYINQPLMNPFCKT